MKALIVLLASLMFLSGCEFQQDPIKGASDAVRQGQPPTAAKPEGAKPLPKEALQIDAPATVVGRVGVPMDFKIQGRVMDPAVKYTLNIDNQSEFPGATYDESTQTFKWTPDRALVKGIPSVDLQLNVTLATVASPEHPTVIVEKKTVIMVVLASYTQPIMNTITGPQIVATGAVGEFQYEMEDIDALGASDVGIMVRDCIASYFTDSVAHLVELDRKIVPVANVPGKYSGKAVLNLREAKQLPTGEYCFALQAVSKYGVTSKVYEKTVRITSSPKNTRITMEATPEVTVGAKLQLAFSIYDPSGAGELNLVSMEDIGTMLPGSTLVCNRSYLSRYQLDCRGAIDATNAQPKTYTLKMTVENVNTLNQKTVTNHTLRIQVKAANP